MTYLKTRYQTSGLGFTIKTILSNYYKYAVIIRIGKKEHSFHFGGK